MHVPFHILTILPGYVLELGLSIDGIQCCSLACNAQLNKAACFSVVIAQFFQLYASGYHQDHPQIVAIVPR